MDKIISSTSMTMAVILLSVGLAIFWNFLLAESVNLFCTFDDGLCHRRRYLSRLLFFYVRKLFARYSK